MITQPFFWGGAVTGEEVPPFILDSGVTVVFQSPGRNKRFWFFNGTPSSIITIQVYDLSSPAIPLATEYLNPMDRVAFDSPDSGGDYSNGLVVEASAAGLTAYFLRFPK